MLRFISLASAVAVLSLSVLLGGCANQQRVAGTQQRATTVNATLTNTGLTLHQSQVQPGNITLKVTNNGTTARTVDVTGPNNVRKSTGSIQPGKTGTVTLSNAKQGTYHVYVSGMQSRAAMNKTLTVGSGATGGTSAGQATTVTAMLTATGLTLSQKSVPAGNVTLKVTNNGTTARTVDVTGPNGFRKSTGSIQPGQTSTLNLPNLKQGSYNVYVAGMQNRTNMKQTLQVSQAAAAGTSGGAQAATVMGTITASGVNLQQKQVQANTVHLNLTNNTNSAKTVVVTGPNNFHQTTSVQPGQTGTVQIANAQQGNYRVYEQGKQGQAQTLAVSTSKVAGTQESIGTVNVTVSSSGLTLSPSRTSSNNVDLNVTNNTNSPQTIVVTGPQNFRQSTGSIAAGQTGTLSLTNVPQGAYQVSVQGKRNMKKTLTVAGATGAAAAGGAAGGQATGQGNTVTLALDNSNITANPSTVSTSGNSVMVEAENQTSNPVKVVDNGTALTLQPNQKTKLFTLRKTGSNHWTITNDMQTLMRGQPTTAQPPSAPSSPTTITATLNSNNITINPASVSKSTPVMLEVQNSTNSPVTFTNLGRSTTLQPGQTMQLFTLQQSGNNEWYVMRSQQSSGGSSSGT